MKPGFLAMVLTFLPALQLPLTQPRSRQQSTDSCLSESSLPEGERAGTNNHTGPEGSVWVAGLS